MSGMRGSREREGSEKLLDIMMRHKCGLLDKIEVC